MMTITETERNARKPTELIKPFKSPNKKRPTKRGSWSLLGEAEYDLSNMGYSNLIGDAEGIGDNPELDNHLKWNIAHGKYDLLTRCVSIDKPYDIQRKSLAYSIDLHGDGKEIKTGELYIPAGDYYMMYANIEPAARKKSIINRICLANVGVLVPHILIKEKELSGLDTNKVRVKYEIIM